MIPLTTLYVEYIDAPHAPYVTRIKTGLSNYRKNYRGYPGTQTDPKSDKGKGLNALKEDKHAELFTAIDQTPTTEYRQNLMRVFKKEFIAEKFKKVLNPITDLVQKSDWTTLKKFNPCSTKIIETYQLHQLVVYYMTIA